MKGEQKATAPASRAPVRLLPASPENEEALVAAALIDPVGALALCVELGITERHFYTPRFGIVFGVLRELFIENEPFDHVTLAQVLKDRGQLADIGGPEAIKALFEFVPDGGLAGQYAKTVLAKAALRDVIHESTALAGRAYDEQGDADEVLEAAQAALFRLAEYKAQPRDRRPLAEKLAEIINELDDAQEGSRPPLGISTGMSELDEGLILMRPAQVIILGGDTDSGKTSLALSIVRHVVLEQGLAAAVFSLENSERETLQRLIAIEGRVPIGALLSGELSASQFNDAQAAAARLAKAKLFIRDEGDTTMLDIRAAARTLKAREGIALAVIDYLQLVRTHERNERNREQEVAGISRDVKFMAKELGIPVIALVAVNEHGQVRESRGIAYDANAVCIISHPAKDDAQLRHLLLKKRKKRSVSLRFDEVTGRWQNYVEATPALPMNVPTGKKARK